MDNGARARASKTHNSSVTTSSTTHLNVQEILGEDGWTVVDRLALTVELATKHLSGDGHLEDVAGELAMSVRVVNVSSSFKDLIQRSRDVN